MFQLCEPQADATWRKPLCSPTTAPTTSGLIYLPSQCCFEQEVNEKNLGFFPLEICKVGSQIHPATQ